MNPGELLPPLRVEQLKQLHRSMPRNKKIAEMFFYAGWIEQWGSGTLKIIRECVEAGLPEPEYAEDQAALWLTFRKDIWTEKHLRSLRLNARQIRAMLHLKEHAYITNTEYQQLNATSRETAKRDLTDLVNRSLLTRIGIGRNV